MLYLVIIKFEGETNMTINQKAIHEHTPRYVQIYTKAFNVAPESWFSLFQWISSFTSAGSFNASDIELAKELLANA